MDNWLLQCYVEISGVNRGCRMEILMPLQGNMLSTLTMGGNRT